MLRLGVCVGVCVAACAPRYQYEFTRATSSPNPDVAVVAELDPVAHVVRLDVTNRTDQVLQVDWSEIALGSASGSPDTRTVIRPDVDLGWIAPGAHVVARLGPFVVPTTGTAAEAYDGRSFWLDVPVTVRREPRVVRVTAVAHVREI